jgi:hypothetical protein
LGLFGEGYKFDGFVGENSVDVSIDGRRHVERGNFDDVSEL